mmetsp:Transcript_20805/g.49462  ORF Transcript_20805/g.49462 Transcript_20805/m.49462 type:complete len:354 (-) Transcript_20805:465-1526(-)
MEASISMRSSGSGSVASSMSSYRQRPPECFCTTKATVERSGRSGRHAMSIESVAPLSVRLSGVSTSVRLSRLACSGGTSSSYEKASSTALGSSPGMGNSSVVCSGCRARHVRATGRCRGCETATPLTGKRQHSARPSYAAFSMSVAAWLVMSSVRNVNGSIKVPPGATISPEVFRSSSWKAGCAVGGASAGRSSATASMIGSSKGFLNETVPEAIWPSGAATSVFFIASGSCPTPVAVYTHSPTLGCCSVIVADCSCSSELGVYETTASTSPYGGSSSGPPPASSILKLRPLEHVTRSGSSSPDGLLTVKECVTLPPTGACSSGSATGTAASATSLSSYQNSPATGLRKAIEP